MSGKKRAVLICGMACLLGARVIAGQEDKPKLTLKIAVEKEVTVRKDGRSVQQRIPVEKTRRGDILVYSIVYTNEGKTEARDSVIVDPVPAGTVYIPGSAEGKDVEITYSIDKGTTFQMPPVTYRVKKPNGTEETKPAPAEMYSHIRWLMKRPVAPGHSDAVSFKAKVK